MPKKEVAPVDAAIQYAKSIEPYALSEGGQGLSSNEEKIVLLAKEVQRLRKVVKMLQGTR